MDDPTRSQESTGPTRRISQRKRFEDFDQPAADAEQQAASASATSSSERLAAVRNSLQGMRLGDVLVAMGVLTSDQIREPESESRMTREYLGQVLMRKGMISPEQLCHAVAIQAGLPVVDLTGYSVPAWTRHKLSVDVMIKYDFVPFADDAQTVYIAAKRPLTPQRINELKTSLGRAVDIRIAPDHQISAMLNHLAPGRFQQKRQHERLKMAMPAWLQLCDERGENISNSMSNTQTVDISEGGFRVEVPEAVYNTLKNARRKDIHFRVRVSLPPHNVLCTCVLRYARKKENVKSWEMPWVLGLQITLISGIERENLKQICTRVAIMLQRAKLLED
ncbi:MAG TPA: PilZ domain-containing protein [Planctomycetota bacterium]|nr:PilZ domain-containing protein [Planctomycetota bacterium]